MPEACENCGTKIGNLEQPFVWQDRVVCGVCYRRLTTSGPNLPRIAILVGIGIVAAIVVALLLLGPSWREHASGGSHSHGGIEQVANSAGELQTRSGKSEDGGTVASAADARPGALRSSGAEMAELLPNTSLYVRFTPDDFDPQDATSIRDLSPSHNHIVTCNLQTGTLRPIGPAAVFGPDTWVTVADNASLRPVHALTVAAIVRVDSTQTSPIVSKDDWDHATNGYTLRLINNKPDFTVGVDGWKELVASEPIGTSSWHHLAGTYDGQTLRLYVDGSEVARRSLAGDIAPSFFPLELGVATFDHGRRFLGDIAEVVICGQALSAQTIAQMAARLKGTEGEKAN